MENVFVYILYHFCAWYILFIFQFLHFFDIYILAGYNEDQLEEMEQSLREEMEDEKQV